MDSKIPVVRTQVIIVDEVGQNSYGDLTFSDTTGEQYKISTKRRSYFEKIISPGNTVQLNFAEAYGKQYIYSATLDTPQVKPQVDAKIPIKPVILETTKKGSSRDRSVAIAYAKDLAVVGKIELKDIRTYANRFLEYILEGD